MKPLRDPDEVARKQGQRIFDAWARGWSYEQIGRAHKLSVEGVRTVLRGYVHRLWKSYRKWQLAEMRCRALAMELHALRLGRDEPDQPIETLHPPPSWLDVFKRAGVLTVNQLRSVPVEIFLGQWRFPKEAIRWAILHLDKLGLSHRLQMPRRATYLLWQGEKKLIPCPRCGSIKTYRNGYHKNGEPRQRCPKCKREWNPQS